MVVLEEVYYTPAGTPKSIAMAVAGGAVTVMVSLAVRPLAGSVTVTVVTPAASAVNVTEPSGLSTEPLATAGSLLVQAMDVGSRLATTAPAASVSTGVAVTVCPTTRVAGMSVTP